ncbi:MAG: DoxX family membrane protein [Actinobacteria bacterium]|nr:DoxX family membrane protein [Actinomycetota bacterium]
MQTLSLGRSGLAPDTGALILRVVAGPIMAYHGWMKVQGGVSNFAGFLDSLSIPSPTVMAYLVTFLELVGGILILLGLITRFWSLLLAAQMVFTTILVKADVGLIVSDAPGAEIDLLFLATTLTLVFLGPGKFSLDYLLQLEKGPSRARSGAPTRREHQRRARTKQLEASWGGSVAMLGTGGPMSRRSVATLMAIGLVASLFVPGGAVASEDDAGGDRNELEADLNGRNELDPMTLKRGAGDLNGEGEAELNLRPRRRMICFDAEWENIGRPVAGHIHEGNRYVNGPVVVDLGAATREFEHEDGDGGAEGCARDVERALIRDIRMHPRHYYVNIHNAAFPDGAIRGQLLHDD